MEEANLVFDFKIAFYLAVVIIQGLSAWLIKILWDAIQDLKQDLSKLKDSLPSTYARRDDITGMFSNIMAELRELRMLISEKADKK